MRMVEQLSDAVGVWLQRSGTDPCLLARSCGVNHQRLEWLVLLVCLDQSHPLDDAHAALDATENRVFSIQVRRRGQRDEPLAAVRVGTCSRGPAKTELDK